MTPHGTLESELREQVRDILGLHWNARDDQILDELRRVKVKAAEGKEIQRLATSLAKEWYPQLRGGS